MPKNACALTKLDLYASSSLTSAAFLGVLAQNSVITELDLADCRIESHQQWRAVSMIIRNNGSLDTLNLRRNPLTLAPVARELARAIDNSSVGCLNVSSCFWQGDGREVFEAFVQGFSVRNNASAIVMAGAEGASLDLSDNGIESEDTWGDLTTLLGRYPTKIQKLTLGESQLVSVAHAQAVAQTLSSSHRGLQILDLSSCVAMLESGCSALLDGLASGEIRLTKLSPGETVNLFVIMKMVARFLLSKNLSSKSIKIVFCGL